MLDSSPEAVPLTVNTVAFHAPPPVHAGAQQPSNAPVAVTRRAPVELTLPLAASGGGAPVGAPEDPAIDFTSPLDVPAFLRRQN